MDDHVVIVAAYRSAIGSFLGSLSGVPVHEISKAVLAHTLLNTNVSANDISEVIMGNVLSSGCGQNPARQAAIAAGIPVEIPAWSVDKVCGSGLMSVALGCDAIKLGRAQIVIAGGHENMSRVPHAINIRSASKMGMLPAEDLMIKDGLTDAFSNLHMGITAENIAEKFNISRDDQDLFASESQNKAEKAKKSGRFKNEIVPITISTRKGDIVFDEDEFVREGVTIDSLSHLRPAFKKDGTVTAGNASGINDGSAVVMMMRNSEAQRRGLPVLAKIISYASVGVDPSVMGIGPIPASHKALSSANWTADEVDLIEVNEAFAAQSIYVGREMKWDSQRVNVNGGAIALGHPIGASGARILVTLLHEMTKRNSRKGLATLCIGGGMGIAMCVER